MLRGAMGRPRNACDSSLHGDSTESAKHSS